LHPDGIDHQQSDRDDRDFDDENKRSAVGDPDRAQKYVLYVGIVGQEPGVPLIIERLPGKADIGKYRRAR
jgi:hypothetical protein